MTTEKAREVLEMALVGFRHQIAGLKEKIAAIEQELRASNHGDDGPVKTLFQVKIRQARKQKRRGTMSAEGRARVAAAQRKRWARVKRAKKAA